MKKYTAKHPDGTTYELTLEEMQSPQIIQQLQIDSSWSVKMGEKWESFNAFLWEQNQVHSQKPAEKRIKNIDRTPSITGPMLQANAHWNPCSVFGLTLRLIGLYFALKGLSGLVDFVVGYSHIQSATNQIIQHSSISTVTVSIGTKSETWFLLSRLSACKRALSKSLSILLY